MLNEYQELLGKKENLHPDLVPYIMIMPQSKMLNHPMVQSVFYNPAMNAILNKQYEYKREAIKEAINNQKWLQAIFLHERPYRYNILEKYQDLIEDDAEYWACVGGVWQDSENIWQNYHGWYDLWDVDRSQRIECMDENDQEKFNALPQKLTIYRGIHDKGCDFGDETGMAWTLSEEKAKWFAERWQHKKKEIICAEVEKKHVYAYFGGRGEQEIVADPGHVNFLSYGKI